VLRTLYETKKSGNRANRTKSRSPSAIVKLSEPVKLKSNVKGGRKLFKRLKDLPPIVGRWQRMRRAGMSSQWKRVKTTRRRAKRVAAERRKRATMASCLMALTVNMSPLLDPVGLSESVDMRGDLTGVHGR
jgi:hypothetical protein